MTNKEKNILSLGITLVLVIVISSLIAIEILKKIYPV